MSKRLKVNKPKEAIQVTRVSIKDKKLVYVILANKLQRYPLRRSKIAYIGTTQKGISRIAQSVAARAENVLSLHGVREFTVHVITCSPRPNVKTWEKLERALLIVFRQRYGALPKCNTQGKNMKERDEFKYFRRDRLEQVLEKLV